MKKDTALHYPPKIFYHTLYVPLSFFMNDTRKISTGRRADVISAMARAHMAVMVEMTSLSC